MKWSRLRLQAPSPSRGRIRRLVVVACCVLIEETRRRDTRQRPNGDPAPHENDGRLNLQSRKRSVDKTVTGCRQVLHFGRCTGISGRTRRPRRSPGQVNRGSDGLSDPATKRVAQRRWFLVPKMVSAKSRIEPECSHRMRLSARWRKMPESKEAVAGGRADEGRGEGKFPQTQAHKRISTYLL